MCHISIETDDVGAVRLRAGMVPPDVQRQAHGAVALLADDELIYAERTAMQPQKPGRSRQDYGTPQDFLAAVKARLQIAKFAIDLAASPENAVTDRCYTVRDNALVQPWKAPGWSWLNPPFAKIGPWVERAWQQSRLPIGAHIAMLVPAGVGSNWWRDCVHEKARVLQLNGRITFVGQAQPYPKDCCLLLYGPYVFPGYEVWTWPLDVKAIA